MITGSSGREEEVSFEKKAEGLDEAIRSLRVQYGVLHEDHNQNDKEKLGDMEGMTKSWCQAALTVDLCTQCIMSQCTNEVRTIMWHVTFHVTHLRSTDDRKVADTSCHIASIVWDVVALADDLAVWVNRKTWSHIRKWRALCGVPCAWRTDCSILSFFCVDATPKSVATTS